jgi:hypothetical protein
MWPHAFSNQYQPAVPELDQLTGVAAILRFPMPELEDEEDSDHENWTQLETRNCASYIQRCIYFV